jgi:hypothetical protein
MMETEEISDTLVFSSILTRLIAREDFSTFILCESFRSYIINLGAVMARHILTLRQSLKSVLT